jgi:hypothetical protein
MIDKDRRPGEAGDSIHCKGKCPLANKRYRIDGDPFSPDIMPVCLVHRTECNLRNLRTTANDDHPGTENMSKRLVRIHTFY